MISMIEAFSNAAIGLVVSWLATFYLLPIFFNISPSAIQSVGITAMFFVLSFLRAWLIREAFRKWAS
jgi:hypothetical protein